MLQHIIYFHRAEGAEADMEGHMGDLYPFSAIFPKVRL